MWSKYGVYAIIVRYLVSSLFAWYFDLIVRLLTKRRLKTDQVKLYGPNGVGYTRATSIISKVSNVCENKQIP